ncbi:MAG: membrane protein insertase YidC [Paracoccaceae bacterium]
MDDQNKNLILATVLSFLVILVWFVLFPPEQPVTDPNAPAATASQGELAPAAGTTSATADTVATAAATAAAAPQPDAPRVAIDTPRLEGSISLSGGRLDDLRLKGYRETLDPTSPLVTLLKPVGADGGYYALYGWAPGGALGNDDVPGPNTLWRQSAGDALAPGKPVTLAWSNGKGLEFTRTFAIDDSYMFTVTQKVTNASGAEVRLAPYGLIAREGQPQTTGYYILHEGVVQMADGTLTETDYSDMPDLPVVETEGTHAEVVEVAENGWIGFTDKNWMSTLVPSPGQPFRAVVKYLPATNTFATTSVLPTLTVASGASAESTTMLFAGAKEWATIRAYQNERGIAGFIDSIDWGWFFFLTKPIFTVLHWLNGMIGNMGLAIIALTLIIKAILFPLARKSYISMARMKELQPEIEKLKERAGEDKQKLQKEMMQLYKDKKVNPAAGCLPILLQIPIFFSLYKVIFVTIELRHAPFFGWLRDLSAPDPSSLFNLFGLLPWAAPAQGSLLALIFIGVMPILLGISMWLQQKLNPAPTDPVQAQIFAWMPWVFMFMLGGFASGLVLYWITNNTITFIQQYAIMRSHGHKPDLFGNIRASFRRGKGAAK